MTRARHSPLRNAVLLVIVALLPIGLLAASSILLASRQITNVVDKQVQTTAAVSAVVIGEQTSNLLALVHSYATRPSLAEGVKDGHAGNRAVQGGLAGLAHALPGISATFVTDLRGTSRNTYPLEPTVIGTIFAFRDWYIGLVETGRPYVSSAIVTQEASHALAVTVTDFITGPNGKRVGILGVNYSLQSIRAFSANVAAVQGVALTVTDNTGTSLTADSAHGLVSLATDPSVQAARTGHTGLLRYAPPLPGGGRGPTQLSAYTPVTGTGWTVIASVPVNIAFAGLRRLRDTVLAITLLLVLVLLAGARVIARSDMRRSEADLKVQSRDRELASVLESTDEAFMSVDAAGMITAWNAQAEDLYGWDAADAIGRNLADTVIPTESRDAYEQDIAGYRAGAGSAIVGQRVEMNALHHDGHRMPVEVGVWAHGEGGGFSAFVHDITERVTIAADLESARDQAMQASRLKSEFLANMSHEIRTPMNGVIGMSALLMDTDLNVHQRDYAETVCSSAEALMTVLDDILDFSKIEAGKLDVESVPFDLRSVVEESAVLLAARAHQNGLELTCRIDPTVPAALHGDPGRLRQVLLNLVGNSVKFTSVGEVNVTARLAKPQAHGIATIELSVHDTGIGMSAASLESLFEPFTQADSSTSRRYGGTGLGLAISRQLVELMGGTLGVSSELGTGSTFTAVIPFHVGAASTSSTPIVDLDGVHALIVDDNLTNRRVLNEVLAGWGCAITEAEGAEVALAVLAKPDVHVDVILLDLNMPAIDGYGLAHMVRADSRLAQIPIVMLTSSAQRGEAERIQKAGIEAYLTKPVRSTHLRNALTTALGHAPAARPTHSVRNSNDGVVQLPIDAGAGTVLLVEDNVVNQKVFTAMLASTGYRVDVAVNGFDALEALDNNRYAAVFMDCQMPVMDGYQTTAKLRQREGIERHTTVIAVTASAMATDRTRCLDAGMDDYLSKPLRAEDIAAKLALWVRAV
jgi:PAS domain S-box-containing protein